MAMFLVKPVVMVAEFVHEYMKQHKGSRLRFGEPAHDCSFHTIEADTNPLKDVCMSLEIFQRQFHPKVFMPRVKKNRSRLFAMVERVYCVSRAVAGQNDTLQVL